MIRKFKVMGLALVAVFAMSAVSASAASAISFHSDSTTGSTILTGEQVGVNVFELTNSGVAATCSKAKFTGTQTGSTAETVTVHPVYEGKCALEPFGEATVDTAGCNYILSAAGVVQIECEGSNKIKITGPGCTVEVGPQTTGGGVSYTNEGTETNKKAIVVTSEAEKIKYTSNGFLCGLLGVSSGEDADYFGSVTEKGFLDESGTEGAQTGIWRE